MRSVHLAIVSAILVVAAACGGDSSPLPMSPTPPPSSPGPGPAPATSSIAIPAGASTLGNRAYSPAELNIGVGETVTWSNADTVPHTSTSDVAGWDSGTVPPGGQFSRAFPAAGTFSYHCTIHPGMVGTVVVR